MSQQPAYNTRSNRPAKPDIAPQPPQTPQEAEPQVQDEDPNPKPKPAPDKGKKKATEERGEPSRKESRTTEIDPEQLTIEEISEGSSIKLNVWKKYVKLDYWDDPDFDHDSADEEQMTAYFAQRMMEYRTIGLEGRLLSRSVREDFEGWGLRHFRMTNNAFLKEMLKVLNDGGVTAEGDTFAESMTRLVRQGSESVKSYDKKEEINTPRSAKQDPSHDKKHELPLPPLPEPQPDAPKPLRQTVLPTPQNNTLTVLDPEVFPEIDYNLPPRYPIYNGVIDPHKVSMFQKGWKKDRNFTGQPYDLFYEKAKFFVGYCRRLQITEDQYHAVFPDILSDRAEAYFLYNVGQGRRWDITYNMMYTHFNTAANHNMYFADWTNTTFARIRQENPDKTLQEVLTIMLDKLQFAQRALGPQFQGDVQLRSTVITACRGVPELEHALYNQRNSSEELFADLRTSLQIATDRRAKQYLTEESYEANETFYNDRRYISNYRDQRGQLYSGRFQSRDSSRGQSSRSQSSRGRSQTRGRPFRATRFTRGNLKCFVCKKVGCWSTNHPKPEFNRAKTYFLAFCEDQGEDPPTDDQFAQYLTIYEGDNGDSHSSDDEEDRLDQDTGEKAVQFLTQTAFFHRTTGEDIYQEKPSTTADQFILSDHYRTTYQGELWDTGAARFSTVGKAQAEAYLREFPRTKVNWQPGNVEIRFGSNPASSAIGTIEVEN
jgi:hypothetical protein